MIFYGETSTEARRSGGSKVRTSYSKYYSNDSAKTTNRRAGFSFENVVFDDRDEARSVLNCLDEAIETYGTISVADLYDLSGITPESSYYNYGWDDIREARVLPCSGGYKIQFPRVIPLR